MRLVFALLQLAFTTGVVMAQDNGTDSLMHKKDTVFNQADLRGARSNSYGYAPARTEHLVVSGNLVHPVRMIKPSFIETQIWELEEMECKALLKRDTATLRKLWARDFSSDAPASKVVVARNPLPYYVSYSRKADNLVITDSVVYARGIESVQMLETNARPGAPIKRRYTNIWKRKLGGWKVIAKYTYPEESK